MEKIILMSQQPKNKNSSLIYETKEFKPCEFLTENVNGIKRMYIQGIFSEFDEKNQNGRVYPAHIMKPEIIRYLETYVKSGRAFGELDHPDANHVTLENVSHRIVNLWIDGNKVYGKALIGGPKGKAVMDIIEMGGTVGVSSRSLGNLNHRNEVTDLQIITWDIVHEPSVASALMEPITESKKIQNNFDWVNDNTGFLTESVKRELKIINNNMLLDEKEISQFAESYIKRYFERLYNA